MRAELADFSGGITDFIFTNDLTCAEIIDNFSITKDRALETRWGSRIIDNTDSMPVTSVENPAQAIEFQGVKVFIYGGQIMVWDGAAWTEVLGFDASSLCLTEGNLNSRISHYEWNKHLFLTDDQGSKTIKLFKDNLGAYQVRTAGLPELASLPTVTPSSNDGKSYIYYYLYKYTYQVGDVTHIDYGPTIQHRVGSAADFGTSQNAISNIPVLGNAGETHYDTTTIEVEIYRTVDAGTEAFLVGSVTNGTTTFNDTTNDEDLILNQLIYNATASDNAHPPVAKFIDIANSCGWYVNVAGYPYRAMQSQISDPDSVPADYYLDFEEELVGWSSYQSNPIAFTENQMWRVEGVIELDGSGDQRKVLIAEGVTTINHNSIVKTDKGVFFAGPDSFYRTDGYTAVKIPSDDKNIPVRYQEFAGNTDSIKGSFDRINNRVYWTVKISTTEYKFYIYDVSYNSLTTWSGQSDDFRPTAVLCSKDGYIYRPDVSGYIFVHDKLEYSDPVIDATKVSSLWNSHPVIYSFKHIANNFGASDINKWGTRVTVSGEGKTPLDVSIFSYDDSTTTPKELVPISYKAGLVWGDPYWIWDSPTDVWLWVTEPRLNQTRAFVSGKLRFKRKQIELTNAFVEISQSDVALPDSRGVVDSTAKTFTIIDYTLAYIPTGLAGMEIEINGVSYPVLEATSLGVLTLEDDSNELVDGTYDWSLSAYPDNQRFHLASIIFNYDTLDNKGGYYKRDVTISAS